MTKRIHSEASWFQFCLWLLVRWGPHMRAKPGGDADSGNSILSSPGQALSSPLRPFPLNTSSPVQPWTHVFLSTLLWTLTGSKNLGLTPACILRALSHPLESYSRTDCMFLQEGPRKEERDFSSSIEHELAPGKTWWRQAAGLLPFPFCNSDPSGLTVESRFMKKLHGIWAQGIVESDCSSTLLLWETQRISNLSHTWFNCLGVMKVFSMASWWIQRDNPCRYLAQHSPWCLGDSK